MAAMEADWSEDGLERDLVVRARHDREAFAALYRRHYRAVAGYVYRRVGDAHVTEDLVAETFLAAMRSIGGYRSRGVPLRAWLYRIATNVVNRWAKRRRNVSRQEDDAAKAAGFSAIRGGEVDAEMARRGLLRLPPNQQAVIALHYLEGLPLEDVAFVLGCRVGTVKSRLFRGREALREMLSNGR